MNEEIINLLDSHNWSESIIKLTAYVVSLCKLKNIILPSGLEAEDIVMTAIEKVYKGDRKWNPVTDPDLHRFLLSVVKSIVSNKITSTVGINEALINEDGLESVIVTNQVESEIYSRQLDKAITDEMKGDPELCLVYKALKDGFTPGDIAEEYAIDVGTIRNAKKRLNRLVLRVIEKLTK